MRFAPLTIVSIHSSSHQFPTDTVTNIVPSQAAGSHQAAPSQLTCLMSSSTYCYVSPFAYIRNIGETGDINTVLCLIKATVIQLKLQCTAPFLLLRLRLTLCYWDSGCSSTWITWTFFVWSGENASLATLIMCF